MMKIVYSLENLTLCKDFVNNIRRNPTSKANFLTVTFEYNALTCNNRIFLRKAISLQKLFCTTVALYCSEKKHQLKLLEKGLSYNSE